MWMNSEFSDRESFVGFLQLYSDKSKTSLKRTGVCAYPIHTTFMNFKYGAWKSEIVEDRTLTAYLPVGIDYEEDIWRITDGWNMKTTIPRVVKLELLHKALDTIMDPLKNVCHAGFPCRDREQRLLQCHPLLAVISADMPEQKDLTCLMHGCQTAKQCCRCEANNVNLNNGKKYEARNLYRYKEKRELVDHIGKLINEARGVKKAQVKSVLTEQRKEVLKGSSMVDCRSFLEESPLLLNNDENNVYQIFGFEPMHVLDLGVSKELKKCLYRRLGKEEQDNYKKPARTAVLRKCNEMLKRIQTESYMQGMNVDFSTSDSSAALNGFFTTDGLCGMLEAKNYRQIDFVFPFVSSFIDRVYGEETSATTGISVAYIEIVKWITEGAKTKYWSEEIVRKLEEAIGRLQELVVSHYGQHQPSNFCTEKFHALSHLGDDIRRYGDIRMLHVGLYENRHLAFKEAYDKTSRRCSTALVEAVQKVANNLILSEHVRMRDQENKRTGNLQRGLSYKYKWEKVSVKEFNQLLLDVEHEMANCEDVIPKKLLKRCEQKFSSSCVLLLRLAGDQGGNSLVSLLKSKLCADNVYIVKSGVITSGGYTCTLNSSPDWKTITSITRSTVLKQRVVCALHFSHSNVEHFSFYIMKGRTECGEPSYFIVQVRALLHVCQDGVQEEMALVKYFDVVKPIDDTERLLGCLCVRWSTDDDIDYTTLDSPVNRRKPPAPWYDVVEFNNLISVVQVVRQMYSMGDDDQRGHWATHRFCVNRFASCGTHEGDCTD